MTAASPSAPASVTWASRTAVFVLVAAGTVGWIVGILAIWATLSVPRFEPYSRRVAIWTVGGETRPAGMLDASYESFVPARFEDGRIYLTAYLDENRKSGVPFFWDAKAERLVRVGSLPVRALPPGAEVAGSTVVLTSGGRVLLGNDRGSWRLFDHDGWREIGPLPSAMNHFDPPVAVELTDGALLLVAASDPPPPFYAASVCLVEAGQVAGAELWNHPVFAPGMAFAAPDGKVALVAADRAPVLWDPRSQKSETLPGPAPIRAGAAGVSLDASHVLFVGGSSDEQRPNRPWSVFVAVLAAWGVLGVVSVLTLFVRLGRQADAAALRWCAAGGVISAVVVPTVIIFLLLQLIDPGKLHM